MKIMLILQGNNKYKVQQKRKKIKKLFTTKCSLSVCLYSYFYGIFDISNVQICLFFLECMCKEGKLAECWEDLSLFWC